LLHLIGGLTKASTGALNGLLDSAAFANLQGGYRTRDARMKDQPEPMAPGEWREVDQSFEDLHKAFFSIPYKEPSAVLFTLLGYLDEAGQKFAGTTDVLTGDASMSTMPVGTVVALIEQGSTKFSAIHQRIHQAQTREFKILAEIDSFYLPEEGYPYATKAGDKYIAASDFDDRIDIIPTSNPSAVTSTQRIVQAQAVLDIADKHPEIMDVKVAIQRLLVAMRIQNFEELFSQDQASIQMQQKLQQIGIDKAKADVDKVAAETVDIKMKTQFSSIQTGVQVLMNPQVVPVGDSLLESCGYKDANKAPVANVPTAPQLPLQPDVNQPGIAGIPQNTSPGSPALPASPEPGPEAQTGPAPLQGPPVSSQTGIETMRNEPAGS
jgi:hypothetical protein